MNPYRRSLTILAVLICLFAGAAHANQLHPVSGAYHTSEVDLKVAARGIPMAWERTYRSNRTNRHVGDRTGYDYSQPEGGPLGYGWHTPFTVRIKPNAAIINGNHPEQSLDAFVSAEGEYIYFDKGPGGLILPDYINGYTLSGGNGGNYTLSQRGGNTWTFDNNGRLLTIADSLNRAVQLVYTDDRLTSVVDAAGRTVYTFTWTDKHITRVTDLANRSIDYGYDGSGNLATVSHSGDTLFTYSYNANHGIIANRNSLGETWQVGYRAPLYKGIATSLTAPDSGVLKQYYDTRNNSITIQNPDGSGRTQVRDTKGQLISEEEQGGGKTVAVSYSTDRSVRTISDANRNTTTETRNLWGETTKRIDAEGGETLYSYNDKGKPTQITDAEQSVTEIAYDPSGTLPITITRGKGSAEQSVTTFIYETTGDLKSTGTGNATTTFTYNDAGLPLTIIDPEGNVTTLAYDTVGNLSSSTDARGNKTEYGYDWRGNLKTATVKMAATADDLTTSYDYNLAGRLTQVTDPKGNVTTTATDFAGRITSISAPAGSTSFSYDKNGNLKTVTKGDAVTTYSYDTNNRLVSTKDPENSVTNYGYSPGSSCTSCGSGSSAFTTPTSIIDPLNKVTTNTLDKLGRIKEISDPLSNLTKLVYDKVGRIKTRTDAENNTTTYSYDKLGRIKSQTDAQGGITGFSYDERGNLLTLTDPETNTTSFEYDRAGRKTKETRPEGEATQYSYYPNGLLNTVTDAKGQTTTYGYDKANRLTETKFSDNTKHTFSYDKNGNLTGYTTPDVSATIGYDAANRKTSEAVTIGGITKSYSYSYDAKGNKQSYTSPEGTVYSYTYNKNDQPKTITTPAGQIALDYSWIRNTKVTFPNGVVTDYGYNDNHWLTQIAAQKAPNTVLSAGYQFDKVGNISQKASDVTTDYGYDKIYQLLSSTNSINPETFTYDKVGNRKTKQGTQTPWSYNKNNELQTAETVTYGYDANGNTTTKTEAGQTVTFNYNATDRLTTVQLPDGRTATYTYDPFGRRIKKQVGSETTLYVYADEGLIGEYTETGVTKKTYGWRPNGIWGTNPLFQAEGGSYYFYHNDHLGTPQSMTDMSGDIVWESTYEAFGKATVAPESTVVNNLRFPGQYWDEETNLHYNWNRYYDPGVGGYLHLDPIGFKGGSVNKYSYSHRNPIVISDNTGLIGGVDDAVFVVGGALIGLVGQALEDAMTGQLSDFSDYLASGIGGGIQGGTTQYLTPAVAGALGASATNLLKQYFNNLKGKQCGYDAITLSIDVATGGALGKVNVLNSFNLVSKGRGNYNSIYKQIRTKFERGQISGVSVPTALKMFVGSSVDGGVIPATMLNSAKGAGMTKKNWTSDKLCPCNKNDSLLNISITLDMGNAYMETPYTDKMLYGNKR